MTIGRANAAKFVERLRKCPGDSHVIAEARKHSASSHTERLSQEFKYAKPGTPDFWKGWP